MSVFRYLKLRSLVAIIVLVASGGYLMAQAVTGTISGTIADSSGQVIAGARVTITNERTNSARTLNTDESGDFNFAAVQPGIYMIKVEHQGFRSFQRQNNVLSANEKLTLGKLVLEIGNLTETVTTVAEGEAINTDSSDNSALLTSDQISLISVKGRDVTSLLRLLPGVSYTDDVETLGEGWGTDIPNISGQRSTSIVVSIDGLMGNAVSGAAKLGHTINLDAVEEVKVLHNSYGAEYGNQGGAMITLIAKSGKKNYFGSAYYYLRNEAFNANRFFNNRDGLPRPLYRHNVWGFNVGGPVQIPKLFPNHKRKKLFFFYSIENPRTITPATLARVTMPTPLERQGNFSQSFTGINGTTGQPNPFFLRDPLLTGNCNATDQSACFRDPSRATPENTTGLNIIPRERWNASGLALLNYFPLPNQPFGRTNTGRYFNYIAQNSVNVPKLSNVLRVDLKPSDKDSVYVKYQTWTADNEGFGTSGWPGGEQNRWGLSSHYLYTDDGIVSNWVHVFGSRLVNEAYFGWRRSTESFIPTDGVTESLSRTKLNYTAPQLFPQNNRLGTIPRVTGLSSIPGTPALINWLDRWGEVGTDDVFTFSNNITLNRRNHNIKAGVYIERLLNGEAPGSNWSGSFNFGTSSAFTAALGSTGYAYANVLLGNFNSYSESMTRNHTNAQLWVVQWYGQDQWKFRLPWMESPRLTLNYGLRFSTHSQWKQGDNMAATFALDHWDLAKAPLLYQWGCTINPIPPTGCPTANRRALNPVTGQLLTDTQLVGAFVPGTGDPSNGMVTQGDPGFAEALKEFNGMQWEPRVGFAWNLFDNSKTVLRGTFGMYHQPRVGGGSIGNLANNPPLNRTLTINYGNIRDLANLTGAALIRPSDVNALERNAKTQGTYNFMFGIERDLGFKTTLRVNYVGSVGRHLGEERNINVVPDLARFLDFHPENRDPVTNGVKPDVFLRSYRGFNAIRLVTYSSSSNYNALQVQVNRRYSRGFQFGIAYTWSKAMDYVNDDNDDIAINRPYRDWYYAVSNYDQRHIFTFNYIYGIPQLSRRWDNGMVKAIFDGWQLSGTTALVSGRPKNISLNGDIDNNFSGGDVVSRPMMHGNPNRRTGAVGADGTPILIDISVFGVPPRGVGQYYGTTPRNFVRLPGVVNFDLALFKNIKLAEKRTLSFRWEAYNVFNHTNFSDIDGTANFDANGNQTNPRFGQASSSRPARVMQGSLRLSF